MLRIKQVCGLVVCGILWLSLLTGCSSYLGNRSQGFAYIERGFEQIESTPGLSKQVELKNIKVIIVGSRDKFRWKEAAKRNSAIIGYATPANEIWIFGKYVDGQIVVNEAVLGHELMHLLNFANSEIADPDALHRLEQLHTLSLR